MGANSNGPKKRAPLGVGYFLSLLVVNLVHILSFLSFRDKRTWVFGSWDGEVFLDNSKSMFLIAQRLPGITPVWVSRNRSLVRALKEKGYAAYYIWDYEAIFYGLRARYYFIDHTPFHFDLFSPTNLWLSGGAKIINFWHGIPLKRIDSKKEERPSLFETLFSSLNFVNKNFNSYVVAPSKFFGRIICSALGVPLDHLILSAYPRNIFSVNTSLKSNFLSLQSQLNLKISKLKNEGNTIIFYIPTFRDYETDPFSSGLIKVEELSDFLKNKKSVFVTKFHKADKTPKSKQAEKMIFLPDSFDLYEVLNLCDILVTDYSSIFFDFLLFNRPIIFFAYDLEKYKKYSRQLYFDYQKTVPGTIVTSFDQLLTTLTNVLEKGDDGCCKRRLDLERKCFIEKKLKLNKILVGY